MIAALRSELRKTMTTRMWWVLLLTMVVYMAFLAGVMAFSFAFEAPGAGAAGPGGEEGMALAPLDLALTVYTLAPTLGYVFPVIMGALSVSGEFRHMTVTPTLLAEPRRTVVLGAKLLAGLPIGLLYGVVGTLTTIGTGAAVLAALGEDPMLTDPEVLRTAALAVLAMTVWAVVGVGFGAALKNQVVAVVVVLAFTQLVEPVLRVALGLVESLQEVPKWLPGAAGEAIAGASFYSASGINELLPRWQGLVVLIGYALVLAAVGRLTTLRRDIT
ncbi:ABC transporter permease [Actinotalea sp. C106]|uniref:ABC transporter permease n=1 Tax=Actinotalea sp. C106 TaxID=2908644 RepID=UPI00202852FA|nr:ABC transporter permease [Actinotalea sp. C106]